MQVLEPEIVRRYHDAVRAGDPDADALYDEWQREVRARLDALGQRADDHRQSAVALVASKGRGVKAVYQALIEDYREADRIKSEVSAVKKSLREARR